MLNAMYSLFDALTEKNKVYKVSHPAQQAHSFEYFIRRPISWDKKRGGKVQSERQLQRRGNLSRLNARSLFVARCHLKGLDY
jgi:hypothetical protein